MHPTVLAVLALSCSDATLTGKTSGGPPFVTLAVVGDDTVAEGAPVQVVAAFGDTETPTDALSWAWTVDGAAAEGTETATDDGAELLLDGLDEGAHEIALVVTDEDGETAEDAVTVTAVADAAPAVAFDAPADGVAFADGEAVAVAVTVTDEDPAGVRLAWTLDGAPIADAPAVTDEGGAAGFALEGLAEGGYALGVTAVDARGQEGTAAVTFTVEAACETATWYPDDDGDGYGAEDGGVEACEPPSEHIADGGDCDDGDDAIHPAAEDAPCNGIDEDCSGAADDGEPCPCPAESRDGSVYLFCDTATDWATARDACDAAGFALVTVDDAAEDAFVLDRVGSVYGYTPDGGSHYAWLGFNDLAVEGTWEWVSGGGSGYTNWNAGEPNQQGEEDCGALITWGTWNDRECGATLGFVCEG